MQLRIRDLTLSKRFAKTLETIPRAMEQNMLGDKTRNSREDLAPWTWLGHCGENMPGDERAT